tara:strand:- start:388 stop:927 length:540 start_codon:yes stop_codon:yes gene_type:complete
MEPLAMPFSVSLYEIVLLPFLGAIAGVILKYLWKKSYGRFGKSLVIEGRGEAQVIGKLRRKPPKLLSLHESEENDKIESFHIDIYRNNNVKVASIIKVIRSSGSYRMNLVGSGVRHGQNVFLDYEFKSLINNTSYKGFMVLDVSGFDRCLGYYLAESSDGLNFNIGFIQVDRNSLTIQE